MARRQTKERRGLHLWYPTEENPVIAVLHSAEGTPVVAHLFAINEDGSIQIALSVPVPHGKQVFYAENSGWPLNFRWDDIIEQVKRTGRAPAPKISYQDRWDYIGEDQFQRLAVAIDAFLDTDAEYQPVEAFLQTPE